MGFPLAADCAIDRRAAHRCDR